MQDTEDYCEQQDSEPDCEESSLEWGLHVLFVYQTLQLLTLWGVYSLWTGLRDAGLPIASPAAVVCAACPSLNPRILIIALAAR